MGVEVLLVWTDVGSLDRRQRIVLYNRRLELRPFDLSDYLFSFVA
jgi:hypothetical protein